MAAPQGNRFWEARSSHGRKPTFASAEALREACIEYFEWAESHPLWENKVTQHQGSVIDMPVAKMRAMTIEGLTIFLDITTETWRTWREHDDFSAVVTWAEKIIRDQKLAGAAADLLNANIIARDLGLRDESRTELAGTVTFAAMSDEQIDAEINKLIAEKMAGKL